MRNKTFNKRSYLNRRRRAIFSRKLGFEFDFGKNILIGVLIVAVLSLVLLGVIKILSGSYFRINQITSIGERSVSKEEIVQSLDEIKGKIIFFVRKEQIATEINKDFAEIKVENVAKYWPNKLQIVLSESDPLFFYTNLSGVYLLNEDGKIIESIFQDKINFSNDQLNLITGIDGVNSPLVIERLKVKYKDLNTEQPSEANDKVFDPNIIPLEEQLIELSQIKNELTEQSTSLMQSYQEKYDKNEYPDLENLYNFDNTQYSNGDFVDKNKLQLTREVVKFFNQVDKEFIKEIFWEGDFLVKLVSNSGQNLIFGTNREASLQLSDYMIVTNELKNEGYVYKLIDFTSPKISVK